MKREKDCNRRTGLHIRVFPSLTVYWCWCRGSAAPFLRKRNGINQKNKKDIRLVNEFYLLGCRRFRHFDFAQRRHGFTTMTGSCLRLLKIRSVPDSR